MKQIILLLSCTCFFLLSHSQIRIKNKKYPSLMWEIRGNGLQKPSYLFGTMHVSSKIAFNLSDSFYLALFNADVVALETNPESWQEDLTKYELENYNYTSPWRKFSEMPGDYLTIRSLKFDKYEKQIEQALFIQPSTINNLLYRNYSDYSSDFEEDTYLDMYIYQLGKKMGKRVAGVERYNESMKLMMEAYKDAARDKNKKERSFDVDEPLTPDKIQEAYRTGNLDLLDSINRLNSFSDAFDEKFLYKRNEIQAHSIDSILKTKASLFVGVGAAHLPGNRGVIEILRRKGYRLRPVMMTERDSRQKERVEKIRVPVTFNTQVAEDGFFKVDMPGKLYRFNEDGILDQLQYADMANGSYYIVTRVKTNSLLWGHNSDVVYKKIDSVLYENIPGRIIEKQIITRNGYKGFDITNRTRRGDVQRYNIFITPYEILFFKMSGNGEYVKEGDEAKKFFSSIQIKEIKKTEWKKFQPKYGGFSAELPHEPFESFDGNRQYDAEDKESGTSFSIIRTDVHNYHFAEEDSFDLGLMEESFASSEFINKQVSRKQFVYKGYPALDAKYLHNDGSVLMTRFIIQGPHYYTLIAHARKENQKINAFLNSFEITPFIYAESKERTDTALYYTVNSPVFHAPAKEQIDYQVDNSYRYDDENETDFFADGAYKNSIISNDTTGEKIYVSFYKMPQYYYTSDSSRLDEENDFSFLGEDTTWIVRSRNKYERPDKMKVWEYVLSDTNSSRTIYSKMFYKNGVGFALITEGDTLTPPSSFIKNFFETFNPADTLKGTNPFTKKSAIFFNDFFSRDSVAHKRAVKAINDMELDENDLPLLQKAVSKLNWSEKNYLAVKKSFIEKLSEIDSRESSDYLKQIYFAAADTVEWQYAALESLLQHQTQYAFNIFKEIIVADPPVIDLNVNRGYSDYKTNAWSNSYFNNQMQFNNGDFMDELYDSLQLTRTILPELLALLNLGDYKWSIMRVLGSMVDSNLVQPKDYEMYFNKFLLEAKQELKKQTIAEKKKSIAKAMEDEYNEYDRYSRYDEEKDFGNEDLSLYATLLLPFWENPNVPPLFQQMLKSGDKRLKYNTMQLLMHHNKTIPDTLLNYFASLDEYRYELYADLKEINKIDRFPSKFHNHLALAKSSLLSLKTYGKPDSLLYLDKLSTDYRGKKGYIYFFKYKQKKDDAGWKIATVGLVPQNPRQFEFEKEKPKTGYSYKKEYYKYDFTSFTETRLNEDEPVQEQLDIIKKRMLYSKRKSGKMFYDEREIDMYGITPPRISN